MTTLAVEALSVEFEAAAEPVRVLRELSFAVDRAETVALVGESGCGKSMTALAIMNLLPPRSRIAGGSVRLRGQELVGLPAARMAALRGDRLAMIFQDPMTALNPVFTVGEQIAEVLRVHRRMDRPAARAKALDALRAVEIRDPERRLRQYPHELSGGMRQRVMIAMAIACEPDLLIADEPTTALDVTVQAQVFAVLRHLRDRIGMAMLLITHDMGVVAEQADRAIVMYAGRAVESGPVDRVVGTPRHPYTRGLIACIPDADADADQETLTEIPGIVPALATLGPGCAFAERCAAADDKCRTALPPPSRFDGGQLASCWRLP